MSPYTETTTHEAGHYVGLSHPHDGYDSATGRDVEPVGSTTFVWTGDESATLMSYLYGETTYDVFDRDNLARWTVTRLLDLADRDAATLLSQPRSATVYQQLAQGDTTFGTALRALKQGDWTGAATAAAAGYRAVQAADTAAGVVAASTRLEKARSVAQTTAEGDEVPPGTPDPTSPQDPVPPRALRLIPIAR